jgi:hypothetical protein
MIYSTFYKQLIRQYRYNDVPLSSFLKIPNMGKIPLDIRLIQMLLSRFLIVLVISSCEKATTTTSFLAVKVRRMQLPTRVCVSQYSTFRIPCSPEMSLQTFAGILAGSVWKEKLLVRLVF